MIEKIKALRVQIDGLAQLTKGLKPNDALWGDPKVAPENAAFKWIMVNSKEINQAHDSLILAKAWLGKILGELGNPTPYQNDGKRTDVNSIEPTADTAKFDVLTEKGEIMPINKDGYHIGNFANLNHIEKVDWLRQEIEKISKNELSSGDMTEEEHQYIKDNPDCGKLYFYETMYQQYLTEARFWLGFELQRIREEQTK